MRELWLFQISTVFNIKDRSKPIKAVAYLCCQILSKALFARDQFNTPGPQVIWNNHNHVCDLIGVEFIYFYFFYKKARLPTHPTFWGRDNLGLCNFPFFFSLLFFKERHYNNKKQQLCYLCNIHGIYYEESCR